MHHVIAIFKQNCGSKMYIKSNKKCCSYNITSCNYGVLPELDAKKPFECDACGRCYKYKRNLGQHKRLECGKEAALSCPLCAYRTKHKSNLKAHYASKHVQQNFVFWFYMFIKQPNHFIVLILVIINHWYVSNCFRSNILFSNCINKLS